MAFFCSSALLVACGAGTTDIDGSSTVFPISEAMVEDWGDSIGGSARLVIGISGTGGGFKKFCSGDIDINDASRPIKASEVEKCADEGVEFIELPVAIDGLTVGVNPDNDFVECVTMDELHIMWRPEAEGEIHSWNQVRHEWPEEDMRLYGPGVDSGTFDYFTETVNGESQASRGDFTSSERDNVLVQGIAGDKGSLGYFGYSYFVENQAKLKMVGVDAGDGCVYPTDETINNGTYSPLSRPLFIYVSKESWAKQDVKDFVSYYVSYERADLLKELGFVPFPDVVHDLVLDRFQRGLTGTIFGGANPEHGTVEEILSANQ
ncbi:MAG: PstS family phosphate ABC transporter substrate-binding protein [Chloroflexota bacterium]|nr:PstS family phosphate ABC transporter substrate-binding protein [Dehalococcoidia bacterium]MEC8856536.1 PstS family phosphate ABC transporter substrate-binding protein [Chloroflexota bacterium]MEC9287191.1 PstS family phosphate ABC transporter substrate-binding protein [Chloroflexota bacterium]MEC9447569.1 PstS family phosphate ABC transporter substrate-binding protein [Chloroflexota bacterium]MED5405447.1 PstS family phosphate ABC transporter substrate-binding protein [Chloroflexota bacteri